ncbi:MAG: PqqD family peptide modification chaperone [Deltaproteobacteria bacterium]|nr:PqqD family peptide modification chaperone [Deltaproteobacteria bacterium]
MAAAGRPVANPSVLLREEFDDMALLFDADSGNAVGINRVGVAIWKRLDGTRGLEQIAAELRETYAGVPGTALEETKEFVDTLVQDGFVGFDLR